METLLQRIGMSIQSVSSIELANPGEELVEGETQVNKPKLLNINDLMDTVRQSEIDLEELIEAVRDTVTSEGGSATITQVLSKHPASQGLGSIVGLLHLGLEHGLSGKYTGRVPWEEGNSVRFGLSPSSLC